jgi:hypothetical protein
LNAEERGEEWEEGAEGLRGTGAEGEGEDTSSGSERCAFEPGTGGTRGTSVWRGSGVGEDVALLATMTRRYSAAGGVQVVLEGRVRCWVKWAHKQA